jgi:hypothetical protein
VSSSLRRANCSDRKQRRQFPLDPAVLHEAGALVDALQRQLMGDQ